MKTKQWIGWGLLAAVIVLTLLPGTVFGNSTDMLTLAIDTIKSFEGFIPVSEWDYKQYTYGYGNAAPGPGISISRADADALLLQRVKSDYATLLPQITVPFNANQWAALLSFSFEEGVGAAEKLLDDINSQSDGLEAHFKEYIYAGGVVDADIVARRNKEWALFTS